MKELVLVTGITGQGSISTDVLATADWVRIVSFVGTEVSLAFFKAGFRVRGTVRSAQKAEQWIARFPKYKSDFEHAVVEDIGKSGAFDDAIKGVEIVAHTASPFHFNLTDNEKDMLIPAIQGTLVRLRDYL